ncbi:MAG: glycosyltransferase [Bacteroides sp.]|nr:glycosyltransferase [Bacteroidales bacterium]MBD5337418.1 glycosyltransferase [Bacteroides sp.]
MKFSIIVPVYDRPDEIEDLLRSLAEQTDKGFEIVIVEDGSKKTCRSEAERYASALDLQYFYKENEGRSIARNYGMDRARGEFFVFVDSDCILPPDYIEKLRGHLQQGDREGLPPNVAPRLIRFFGGPDAAHESFTPTQKAINFAMTSFFTTGGIRGGKVRMEKFVPRTFNMGFDKHVYEVVGGFREMFSEDIDMSTRIRQAGVNPVLLRDVIVYHKRRGDLAKFWRQVRVFGMSRITLQLLYPGSMKAVHWAPALFVIFAVAMLVGACFNPWWLLPLGLYLLILFIAALVKTRSVKIAGLGVAAGMVQLFGYGTGFIQAYVWKILLRHGRDEAQEVEMRRGK